MLQRALTSDIPKLIPLVRRRKPAYGTCKDFIVYRGQYNAVDYSIKIRSGK